MSPLPFTWPYALLFWAVEIWAFVPEFRIIRRSRDADKGKDARSRQLIMLGNGLSFLVALPLAFIPALRFPGNRVAVFLAGVTLMVLGSLFRRHCWRMLGESFTGEVRATSDQAVVTRGAYGFLRHPSYTAAILMNTGVGVAFGSWASALIMFVPALVVYGYRIKIEEQALLAAIGEPYANFMRTRKRLIPFLF